MNRRFTPKVVTANDLLTGEAVYLTGDGRWSPTHREAALLTDAGETASQIGTITNEPTMAYSGALL